MPYRRGIFRKFNGIIKLSIGDIYYKSLNNLDGFDCSYLEVIEWAQNNEAVYNYSGKKKEEKIEKEPKNMTKKTEGTPPKYAVNLLAKVAYQYSKKAMETFFRDDRLNALFVRVAPKIKEMGHEVRGSRPAK